jgi:hypothetical protein
VPIEKTAEYREKYDDAPPALFHRGTRWCEMKRGVPPRGRVSERDARFIVKRG